MTEIRGLKGKSVKRLHFTFSHPKARKHNRGKKKLKAKELQDGMSHSSVIRRKTAEIFEEKVGMA